MSIFQASLLGCKAWSDAAIIADSAELGPVIDQELSKVCAFTSRGPVKRGAAKMIDGVDFDPPLRGLLTKSRSFFIAARRKGALSRLIGSSHCKGVTY